VTAQSYLPGDVIIENCMITGQNGSLDATQSLLEARVYESIATPNYVMELEIFDDNGAVSTLNLSGGETVDFSFCAPGGPIASYSGVIDKIEVKNITGTQKGKEYIFTCPGKETFISKGSYVQKSYNTDIASIVRDLHTNFLQSISPLITEATFGIQKIIIPNLKPFEAIDMVRRRATSAQNQSSTFLYFQNYEGHNFKTIEGMMQGSSVKTLTSYDGIDHSIFNNTLNNIIDYEIPQIIVANQRVDLGSMTQRVATFDIRSRQYIYQDQTIDGSGGKTSNPGRWNSTNFIQQFAQKFNFFSMIPWDSFWSATNIPQTTPLQMAYMSNLLQNYVNVLVNGDPTVKVGDIVTLDLPMTSSLTGALQNDPQISGNYLVSRLVRSIKPRGETPRYTETLEAISGSPAT